MEWEMVHGWGTVIPPFAQRGREGWELEFPSGAKAHILSGDALNVRAEARTLQKTFHLKGWYMDAISAAKSGEFLIGGDVRVHRLGYGTMRLVGEGAWGEPEDPAAAKQVLRRAVELGVNLID